MLLEASPPSRCLHVAGRGEADPAIMRRHHCHCSAGSAV